MARGRQSLALRWCCILTGEDTQDPALRDKLLVQSAAELGGGPNRAEEDEEALWWEDKLTCLQALGRWGDVTQEVRSRTLTAPDLTARLTVRVGRRSREEAIRDIYDEDC